MLLAIDQGNSQACVGVYEGESLKARFSFPTEKDFSAEKIFCLLEENITQSGIKISHVKKGVLCSVVPWTDALWAQVFEQFFSVSFSQIHCEMNLGFTVAVDNPKEVGADRLANSAYAVRYLKLPAVIIDIGTATTFDVIDEKKRYLGGAILPGLRLLVESLSTKTAKLPLVPLEFPERVIGKNTVECIQSGVVVGYLDTIEGLLRRTEEELGQKATCVVTGGYAELFRGKWGFDCTTNENLTLEGIRVLGLETL